MKNPTKASLFHVFEADSGALIGTAELRKDVLAEVRKDIKAGAKKTMDEQIESGKKIRSTAKVILALAFFSRFAAKAKRPGVSKKGA